ncbi:MAG: hypothetical protein H6600_06400 [Flavobacteriales bacterium]|nr:hypothetical protein [Flavobacteriales bacterium]
MLSSKSHDLSVKRILFVILYFFILGTAISQETPTYMRIGDFFSFKFTSYNIMACSDQVGFSKRNDSTFVYSEAIDYLDLAQDIKLKIKRDFDSVSVAAGYYNRYGVEISETEGAFIYQDNDPKSYHFSGWTRAKVISPNHEFSLKFFDFGKGFVNNDPPSIDKKVVKEWCATQDWCPSDKAVSVYCTEMTIRISIYKNGIATNYYLIFDRRVGEC